MLMQLEIVKLGMETEGIYFGEMQWQQLMIKRQWVGHIFSQKQAAHQCKIIVGASAFWLLIYVWAYVNQK